MVHEYKTVILGHGLENSVSGSSALYMCLCHFSLYLWCLAISLAFTNCWLKLNRAGEVVLKLGRGLFESAELKSQTSTLFRLLTSPLISPSRSVWLWPQAQPLKLQSTDSLKNIDLFIDACWHTSLRLDFGLEFMSSRNNHHELLNYSCCWSVWSIRVWLSARVNPETVFLQMALAAEE